MMVLRGGPVEDRLEHRCHIKVEQDTHLEYAIHIPNPSPVVPLPLVRMPLVPWCTLSVTIFVTRQIGTNDSLTVNGAQTRRRRGRTEAARNQTARLCAAILYDRALHFV